MHVSKVFVWICCWSAALISGSAVRADVQSGLAAYWKFEETAGPTAVDSIGDFDATLSGDATFANDLQRGQVLSVDGDNDNALANANPLIVTGGTALGWVKLDPGADDAFRIMFPGQSMPGGHRLYIFSDFGEFGVRVGSAVSAFSGQLFGTDWHQIALTWTAGPEMDGSGDYVAYFDGQSVLSATYFNLITPATWVSIGSNYDPGDAPPISSPWKGQVDEVGLWTRPLSAEEVLEIYTRGKILDQISLPGDVNNDGVVDIFDVNVVSDNWGTTGPTGDANGDHIVDIFDVNVISDNWTTSGSAAVPEPMSVLLLSLGIASVGVVRLATGRLSRRPHDLGAM